MWLKHIIQIIGKLSLTREQANLMFGYNMKQGAKGIVLQRRKNRIFIRSLMPKTRVNTKMQQMREKKMSFISKIGSRHMQDLIDPIWTKERNKNRTHHKYISGFNMFVSLNMKGIGIPPDWKNMLITIGKLAPPEVLYSTYSNKTIKMKIEARQHSKSENKEIGIGVLDTKNFELIHIEPKQYNTETEIRIKVKQFLHHPILYVYFKQNNEYSTSTAIVPKYRHG
ncbi:MAG: hypothetical protein QMD71_00380 [bacterium]|nr:hypothetical protein [bacterium]